MSDPFFERRLAVLVRGALDAESGPHATWTTSPAAARLNAPRKGRAALGGLRLLAVAAVLVSAAVATGALMARPVVRELPVANGWLAYLDEGSVVVTRDGTVAHRVVDPAAGPLRCPRFLSDGTLTYSVHPAEVAAGVTRLGLLRLDNDGRPSEPARALPIRAGITSWCPEWSPDGSRFAYVEGIEEPGDLAVMGLDGTREVVMPRGAFGFGDLDWSPDGSALAVVTNTGPTAHTSQLWIVELETGAARLLVTASDGELIETAAWSPDGTRMAIGGTSAHVTVDAEGDVGSNDTAHFVRLVALDGKASGVESIDVVPAPQPDPFIDGWTLFSGPAWSPDSTSLAWIRSGRLMVLDDQSREPTSHVLQLDREAWAAQLIGWSPDGHGLLTVVYDTPYLERHVQSSLVVLALDKSIGATPITAWSRGWKDDVDWQRIDGTTPADLSALPTFGLTDASSDAGASVPPRTPTPPPMPDRGN